MSSTSTPLPVTDMISAPPERRAILTPEVNAGVTARSSATGVATTWIVSRPSPISMVDMPVAVARSSFSRSSPAPAVMTSWPPRPSMSSLPSPPMIVSAPEEPSMRSLPEPASK